MRYKIIVSYDGSNFNGYQRQDNGRTIQAEIEKAIKLIAKEDVTVHASGRTDAGVHAKAQVIHFDTTLDIPSHEMKSALNATMPNDIYVRICNRVSEEFHSRYSAKAKEYEYLINIGEYNPLLRNYVLQYNRELDVDKMREAIEVLVGEHDFTSFTTAVLKEGSTNVRTINEVSVEKKGSRISIVINGTGFMKYMVRGIVGTLVDIGRGHTDVNAMVEILEKKSRDAAGPTIDSCGLYLTNVFY